MMKSAGISRVKDFKFTPVKEGYAPGDVDQKVGAVTAIPKKEHRKQQESVCLLKQQQSASQRSLSAKKLSTSTRRIR